MTPGVVKVANAGTAAVTKAVVANLVVLSPAVWVTPFVSPRRVVVEVPVSEPILMLLVEPTAALVPILIERVEPLSTLPLPMLIVPLVVEFPKVRLAAEKVLAPLMV